MKYLTEDWFFSHSLTYKCHTTLNDPDGLNKVQMATSRNCLHRLWLQQGRGGVIFWGGNISGEVVVSRQAPVNVKLTTKTCTDLGSQTLSEKIDDFYAGQWSIIFEEEN